MIRGITNVSSDEFRDRFGDDGKERPAALVVKLTMNKLSLLTVHRLGLLLGL